MSIINLRDFNADDFLQKVIDGNKKARDICQEIISNQGIKPEEAASAFIFFGKEGICGNYLYDVYRYLCKKDVVAFTHFLKLDEYRTEIGFEKMVEAVETYRKYGKRSELG